MKKLISILGLVLVLTSCDAPRLQGPLIVDKVEFNNGGHPSDKGNYIITFRSPNTVLDAYLITDTKYAVGDTLK